MSGLSMRGLMFTDIEGSTTLVRRLGDRYEDVLARHQLLIREAAATRSGREQSREGDSLFITFPSVTAALETAVDAQCRLEREPWPTDGRLRVRIGVHVGEVAETRAGLVGLAIHQAARIASAAHGGQIVVSGEVVQQAGRLPTDTRVRKLGTYELRDVGTVALYQVEHPDLASEFPQLRTRRAETHNLPTPLTSLVGRADETVAVRGLLADHRLVTLLGAGGIGKTRLALQVADVARSRFVDGVWFVDLAALPRDSEVAPLLAQVMGVQGDLDDVSAALEARNVLVVLDNCEHVLSPAATLVATLLRDGAALSILATSRVPLDVEGEARYHVPPLHVPRRGDPVSKAVATDAVELFTARVRLVRPDFKLEEPDAEALVELCHRLNGLPLAIELAAARLRAMSLRELVSRIEDPIDVLVGGPRSAPARHQTMFDTIEWSFRLLNADERHLLQHLASFRGGCDVESAEAVWDASRTVLPSTLELLTGLVDKSLVNVRESDGVTRYELHETIREFALESCDGSDRRAIEERHARWFALLASRLGTGPEPGGEQAWIARHDVERNNLRAAAEWLLVHDPPAALRLLLDIELGLDLTAQRMWCYELIERALPLAGEAPSADRAQALAELAAGGRTPTDPEALRLSAEAFAMLDGLDDPVAECAVRAVMARCRAESTGGDPDEDEVAAAVAAADRAGGTYWPIMTRVFLSYGAPPALAESLCVESLRISEDLRLDHFSALVKGDLATIAQFRGESAWALATYRDVASTIPADSLSFYALAEGEHGELAIGIHLAEHLSLDLRRGPHDVTHVAALNTTLAHLRRLAGDVDGCDVALGLSNQAGRAQRGFFDGLQIVTRSALYRMRGQPHAAARVIDGACRYVGLRGNTDIAMRVLEELAAVAVALGERHHGADLLASAREARRVDAKSLSPACLVENELLQSMLSDLRGAALSPAEVSRLARSLY